MSTQVPRLFDGFIDDAAVFPPGSAALSDAVVAHRRHRAAWYAPLVGPLLLPASALARLSALLGDDEQIEIGVIGDVPVDRLADLIVGAAHRIRIRQVEAAVAKRGEDPMPGLTELLALPEQLRRAHPDRFGAVHLYAEIPLTWGLSRALDRVAEARADGVPVAAKFRTGGLAAELFPTSVELAAVIGACRDRDLPFKLTAGLHHAIRHLDPETGFTHHGFANVLAATVAALDGAAPAEVAELLSATEPAPVVARLDGLRDRDRPLWNGFGSCSISEPLTDLIRLGLIEPAADV